MPPDSDHDSDNDDFSMFQEPASYRSSTPPPTFSTHTLVTIPSHILTLRLVGHDPLWGHHLWNSGRVIARYLETHAEQLVKDRNVLELGAGAGLPGLVCAVVGGARKVIITDYPEPKLISNIQYNIDHCSLPPHSSSPPVAQKNAIARGYLWGRDPSEFLPLLDLPPTSSPSATSKQTTNVFTLLILSDLLFNHSEHPSLLLTIQQTLSKTDPTAIALVFFTPHRPWLYEKDMAFFDLARRGGFIVEKIVEEVLDKPMFEEDRGDVELRRRVFGYTLKWADIKEGREAGGLAGVGDLL